MRKQELQCSASFFLFSKPTTRFICCLLRVSCKCWCRRLYRGRVWAGEGWRRCEWRVVAVLFLAQISFGSQFFFFFEFGVWSFSWGVHRFSLLQFSLLHIPPPSISSPATLPRAAVSDRELVSKPTRSAALVAERLCRRPVSPHQPTNFTRKSNNSSSRQGTGGRETWCWAIRARMGRGGRGLCA